VIAFWLAAALVALAPPALAEDGGPPTAMRRAEAELTVAVGKIADRVESLREETFAHDPVAVRVPDEMREVAVQLRALNVLSRERLAARGRAWSDLGLGGRTTPELFFGLLATDLDGVGFDPSGNRLLVAPDRLDDTDFRPGDTPDEAEAATMLQMTGVRRDEPVIAHVLMHAMQHGRSGSDHLEQTTDRLLARSAWAEGEANLVAVRVLFGGLGLEYDIIDLESGPGEFLGGRLLPAGFDNLTGAVADLLQFVYLEGYAQTVQRFKAGGWPQVDAAIRRDTTCRQVLHPGRMPVPAYEPAPRAPFEGLELQDWDTLGERAIVVLFSRLTGKDNLALQVGDGWLGDRLHRWESEGGAVTEWLTLWESDEDVEDYLYGLGKGLPVLYPGSKFERTPTGGMLLETSDKVVRVDRDGQRVRLEILSGEYAEAVRRANSVEGGNNSGNW